MSHDEKIISDWMEKADAPRSVKVMLSNDSRSDRFRDFAQWLATHAPAVTVRTEQADDDALPEIRIQPNITYQAIPQGHELRPFLDILSSGPGKTESKHFSDTRVLEKLAMPAVLKVYIAPDCPFCPQTVSSLAALADQQEMIHLIVIDGALFSEQAEAGRVSSVPTVFLDDQFRWTGTVQVPEIIDMMLNRDPAQLSSETLKQILYDGKAEELAHMMAEAGKIFPGLYELLTHSQWPVRLGAMVTVEYLAGIRRDLLPDVIDELWKQFDEAEDPVKGDILYLFGETAEPAVRSKLETVVKGAYSNQVKEAATDALASI